MERDEEFAEKAVWAPDPKPEKPSILVDNWRDFWRWWSVRLATFAAASIAWLFESPDALLGTVLALPTPLRILFIAAVLVLFVISRIVRQKPNAKAG